MDFLAEDCRQIEEVSVSLQSKINSQMESWLIWLLLGLNIVTFLIYGWDKLAAKMKWWRIPEKTLLSLALLGGSVGALCGMCLFRHKTKHRQFTILVPLFLVIQVILVIWLAK